MRYSLIILFLLIFHTVSGQQGYDKYFTDKVLRLDYMLAGDSKSTTVYPVGMKEEAYFGGSRTKLIDPFGYGNLKYEVFDATENKLIYSRGFCTLYQEWQSTAEAQTIQRSFYEVATMPFPRDKIRFVLSMRKRNGLFEKIFETDIDPSDYFIRKEKPFDVNVTRILYSGDPSGKVDLAFIAEGYTATEMNKFRDDVRKMTKKLFNETPFSSYPDKFNIYAVEAVSDESGTDFPGERQYVNTVLNSSFYTFNTDRYLTTQDIETVNDYAGTVPHDNIIVLINSSRYGGGGVYNYYSGTTTDHPLSETVFIHEFGHGFAGLADEYYTSDVAYNDFYPADVEPWEPNITTLVDFGSKWKKNIAVSTPVPTPAESKYSAVTGLFEGAGYSAKGIYRSEQDCRMKSNSAKGFCAACRQAIENMILFYAD